MSENSKRTMLRIMLFNNRLFDYRAVVKEAKAQGYKCCSLIEFYHTKDSAPKQKYLILRHDVDQNTSATREMFLAEKSLNVTSTYYFRDSTIDIPLIQEMRNAGFEVGYHYETLANMKKAGLIQRKEDVDREKARRAFMKEKEAFEAVTGERVLSCASHGAPENIQMGVSSNSIFEDVDVKPFGFEVEAYSKDLYERYITCHVMDGPIIRNYGYSYANATPRDAISKNEKVILFLCHPNHWRVNFRTYCVYWYALLRGKVVYTSDRRFIRVAM